MFRHNNEEHTIPSQYHTAASSPYRHPAHSPRTDKLYAQTPATTGQNYPRHPNAITSGSTEFCWYRNTFGPRAIKCSPGCTFLQRTSQSKSLNYQGGASNSAPRQTLLRYTQSRMRRLPQCHLQIITITYTFMISTMSFTSSSTLHHQ